MKLCVTHTVTSSVVHRNLTHDSQTLERTQILSTGDWMSKVWFNPYRIILNNKKKQTSITCNKMEERQERFIERKKPDGKDHLLYCEIPGKTKQE